MLYSNTHCSCQGITILHHVYMYLPFLENIKTFYRLTLCLNCCCDMYHHCNKGCCCCCWCCCCCVVLDVVVIVVVVTMFLLNTRKCRNKWNFYCQKILQFYVYTSPVTILSCWLVKWYILKLKQTMYDHTNHYVRSSK